MQFPAVIDLSSDESTIVEIVGHEPPEQQDIAWGDLNGDGLPDLIVNVVASDAGGMAFRSSYVVFGTKMGFSGDIDLSTLNGSNGFKISDNESPLPANRVTVADLDGDGTDDLIVTSVGRGAGGGTVVTGRIAYGRMSGVDGDIDAHGLRGGFIIPMVAVFVLTDIDVTTGDINGDGLRDLIVNTVGTDTEGEGIATTSVAFGIPGGFTSLVDLTNLNGTDGVALDRQGIGIYIVGAVVLGLDIDNDGADDLVLTTIESEVGGAPTLAIRALLGETSGFDGGHIDPPGMHGATAIVAILAITAVTGVDLSPGDLNGDGKDDLIVNVTSTDGDTESHAGYVLFGKTGDSDSPVDLSMLDGGNGFKIPDSGSEPIAVGDFNSDGFDDLLFTTLSSGAGGPSTIEGRIFYGKSSGFDGDIDVPALRGGFIIPLVALGGQPHVDGTLGDLNGDGLSDLIVSVASPANDGSISNDSYVLFGVPGGFDSLVDLSTLNGGNGFKIPDSGSERIAVGDLNGDGFDDLIFTSLSTDVGGRSTVTSRFLPGMSSGFDGDIDVQGLAAIIGGIIIASSAVNVATADVDGDGLSDLIVNVTSTDRADGRSNASYVLLGDPDGFGSLVDLSMLGGNGFTVAENDPPLPSNRVVVGDLNGDGRDDMIVTSVAVGTDGGPVVTGHLLPGTDSGFDGDIGVQGLRGGFIIPLVAVVALSGIGVGTADVDGDGVDNVIVSTVGTDALGGPVASIDIFAGVTLDFFVTAETFDGTNGFTFNGGVFAGACDVNGDGFADVVGIEQSTSNDGYVVNALFGQAVALTGEIDPASFDGTDGFRLTYDAPGATVSDIRLAVGDFDNDGFDDLIVGNTIAIPGGAGGPAKSSFEVHMVRGKATGFTGATDLKSAVGLTISGLHFATATSDSSTWMKPDGIPFFNVAMGLAPDDDVPCVTTGDLNADGFSDLFISGIVKTQGGGAGGPASFSSTTYVLFGGPLGIDSTIDLDSLDGTDGFKITKMGGGELSLSSASLGGDVNGDGFLDLVVNTGDGDNIASYVLFGKPSFAGDIDLDALDGNDGFKIAGIASGPETDGNKVGVVATDDFNHDGFADLLVSGYSTTASGPALHNYLVVGRMPDMAVNRVGTAISQTLAGGDFDDTLSGLDGDDMLFGHGGTDALIGGPGNDMLDAGPNPGNQGDFLLGGPGDDTYIVDSPLDFVDEGNFPAFASYGFGGTDTIVSTADFFWDLYSVGERLVISPDAIDPEGDGTTAVGSVFDNEMVGNDGTNILFGRGGSDVYRPGGGTDFMSFSTLGVPDAPGYTADGVNTLVMERGNSYDIVFEFEPGKDKVDLSDFGLASTDDLFARGVNDGAGNSYFILGNGFDYLYLVGVQLSQLSAGDFLLGSTPAVPSSVSVLASSFRAG